MSQDYSQVIQDCVKNGDKVLNLSILDNCEDKLNESTMMNLGIESCIHVEEIDLTSHKFKNIPNFVSKCTNLKKLKMNRNEISEAPKDSIAKCTQLEELHLRFNSISSWPLNIHKLANLNYLNMGYNNIKDISFGLFQNLSTTDVLTNLTYLDLSSNYLTSFPTRICRMPNIVTLILNNNQMKQIPNISKLTHLKEFQISQCALVDLPTCFSDMKLTLLNLSNNVNVVLREGWNSLIDMDCSHCGLTSVTNLYKVTTLKKLNASLNNIKDISEAIQWTNLVELDISKNNLTKLEKNLATMTNLKVLIASHNQILDIFCLPSCLEKLDVSENKLKSIDFTKDLVHLLELDLSKNDLMECNLSTCTLLVDLKISHNQLKSLNKCISSRHLQILDASNNHISDDLMSIPLSSSLKSLNLSHNFIATLQGIDQYPLLESLDVSFNELNTIPTEITKCVKMSYFSVTQNSLDFMSVPKEIEEWIQSQQVRFVNHFEVPDEIVNGVFLGSFVTASNKKFLKSLGVTHILAVAKEVQILFKDDFEYLFIPMTDSNATTLKNHFKDCFDFMDKALNGGKVLVHCVAGVSRSASVVIAYLMTKNGEKYENAYNMVLTKRPSILPNDSFRKQLRLYDKELIILNN